MSVFKVDLSNINQGGLDTLDSNGNSVQRTVFVMGPNRINRQLKDGEVFTDCNYWKKFAYPQVPHDEAFIVVQSDDGSVYSDIPEENTFGVTFLPGLASDGVLVAGDTYTDVGMSLDILSVYGNPAVFTQIQNLDSSNPATVRLNGSQVFTLAAGTTQIFNNGDLSVSSIEFDNSVSGANNVDKVQVLLSIRTKCTS